MFKQKNNSSAKQMRLKFACLGLLGVFLISSVTYADPLSKIPAVAHYGIGGLECQELLSRNPIFGNRQEKLLHWATGYMSGLATWMKLEGFEATVPWDRAMADKMRPFMLEYCRAYPRDNIASAVYSFYKFRLVPKPTN